MSTAREELDAIAQRLAMTLPPGLKALRGELHDNFKAVLQSNLERLDLVSRERFDAQAALLRSSAEKLKRLEAQIAELEAAARRQARDA